VTAGQCLDWQSVDDKKTAAVRFQHFQCTQPWPTTAGGRRLPQHPRPWEWDAQRHVKNLCQLMRDGDRVLVGIDDAGVEPVDAAVLHLRYLVDLPRFVAQLEVGAVAVSHRSPGPPFRGDEILQVALVEARSTMTDQACVKGLLAGFIHVENNSSMRMAARNEWEPLGDPGAGGYVRWGRALA
jgi:predicted NBD/HSP70 family sugar kinase